MGKGYFTHVEITDFGPYVDRIILPIEGTVDAKEVKAEKFSAYVERLDEYGKVLSVPKAWMSKETEESKGYLEIRDAYPSDQEGKKAKKGSYITLVPAIGPTHGLSAEITAVNGYNVYIHSAHTITQLAPIETSAGKLTGAVYDKKLGSSCPQMEGWTNSTSCDKKCPLNYGYYVPQTKQAKKPLIIWLHGAGEGGVDATIAYTGNKVVALTSKKVQALFKGAYVLAPQTKTFWMDGGSGGIEANGKTIYAEALKSCIDEFVSYHKDIDTDRIYIGGDSNGGFMTMRMIIDYPGYFAAAFPVCEALPDSCIDKDQLKILSEIPLWMVTAKTDTLVNPNEFAMATYKRLKKIKAENAHVTCWDKVEDIHGFFDKDAKGKPYEYFGHFSWIPTFNDDNAVDGDGKPVVWKGKEVTLLQWLAQQSK